MMTQAVTIARWLRRRAENIAVALLSIMFATFIIQIFSRYVLNYPIGWSEEVVITMWLWTVLWGAAFVLSEKEEIRFDIIYSNLSERMRRAFTVIMSCTSCSSVSAAKSRWPNLERLTLIAYCSEIGRASCRERVY